MNTAEFKKLLIKNWKRNLIISFLAGIIFLSFSFVLPKSFITEGTFILIPNFESNSKGGANVYDYDGYYLDQISQSYSKTIVGLIETPEFKKKISEELGKNITFQDLFILNLSTNFKEIVPRVLVLSVKSNTKENSEKMFLTYEKEILFYAEKYNSQKVFKLERLDTVTNSFENSVSPFIYFFVSFFFCLSILFLFNYVKETKNGSV